MASKKKILPVVKPYGRETNAYGSDSYAYCSSPATGRVQACEWCGCRDYMTDYLRERITSTGKTLIDVEKLRILVAVSFGKNTYSSASGKNINSLEDCKKHIFHAKRIINMYEKMAGWELSKISTANHENTENVWLLTGPKNWTGYSHLVSMITFIFRVVIRHGDVVELKTEDDLANYWKNIVNKLDNEGYVAYLRDVHDKLPIIMKHHDKIFEHPHSDKAYPSNSSIGYHSSGGIVSLCRNDEHIVGKTAKTLAKLYKKYKKEEKT